MPNFKYQAMNAKGKQVSGNIEAESSIDAINKLREMGFFPTSVTEEMAVRKGGGAAERKGAAVGRPSLFQSKKVSAQKLAIVIRQFATLIAAGLPLLRSIKVLVDQQEPGYLKQILARLMESVESGSSFSDALKEYPDVFSKLFISMIKAGELSGAFDTVLNRLADYFEKTEKLKKKVQGAMIYPAAILTVAGLILGFLMAFIIPKFAQMFADMDLTLPLITQLLISISLLVKEFWYAPFLVLPLIILGVRTLLKNKAVRAALDRLLIQAPLFGDLFLKVYISRFARTLSTLISSGVPLLQALQNVRDAVGNDVVATAIMSIHDNVREGESIVEPMKSSAVFSPMVVNMIDVGEETGSMDAMLIKIADAYDEDVDNAVAGLTSLLEPIMIVTLAVIVGFLVIALFLPLVSLVSQLSK